MENPASKTASFRFSHAGMVSKESPELLKDGQYRSLLNVCSNQEGSLSSRTGSKQVGSLGSSEPDCYLIRKMVVTPNEDPLDPTTNNSNPAGSKNQRYLGIVSSPTSRDIYRSTDYTAANTAKVATAVESSDANHWEMASYSAGGTGEPFAYFACPNAMLKDSGASPQTTLPAWGTPPAAGVATAELVVTTTNTTVIGASTDTPVVISLDPTTPVGLFDGLSVVLTGVGIVPDGPYDAQVTGYSTPNSPVTTFALFDATTAQSVAPTGAFTPGGYIGSGIPAAGNLDGGSDSSPATTESYDYRFTYESNLTNNEGNPSQTMLSQAHFVLGHQFGRSLGSPINVHMGQVVVTVWGSDQSARPDLTTINIYRRGGILYDTWRQVGTVDNPGTANNPGAPGGLPNSITFTDNSADSDIAVDANQIEIDNDPPVTSTVQVPYSSTITVAGGPLAGWATVTLGALPTGYNLTVGTLAHISSVDSGTEDCVIEAISGTGTGTSVTVYFQYAHSTGDAITVDAIVGQPCHLTANVGDSILVAGDPNNPHILYKSKSGQPESFPVGTDASGAVTNIGVGTPSNGIVNFCEFRGQIICMNASSLFEVALIMGSLLSPTRIADKGLVAQSAWCKTETEIWFMSTDGIWSWDGGSLKKRTEAIDPVFHGQVVNGIYPINMLPSALVNARMEYRRGVVHLLYTSTDFAKSIREIVCEPLYGDRWSNCVESYGLFTAVSTFYTEPDTKSLVLAFQSSPPLVGAIFAIADAVHQTAVLPTVNQTADGWTGDFSGTGYLIPYDIKLPWFDLGEPQAKKLFEEIWLDVDPQLLPVGAYTPTMTVEILFDYSDIADPENVITIALPAVSERQPIALLANLQGSVPDIQSFGREARAISFHIKGYAYPVQATFYSLIFQYQETGMLTAGGPTDWMDLGYPYDKKLHQMAVTFDTEGINRTIVLDTMSGVDGNDYSEAVQSFVLSNPTIMGAGRAKKTFPITDATIAKLVRVRPIGGLAAGQSSTSFFKIHSVEFPEFERYPADIVSFTPWEDGGTPYLKYANQIVLEVNTLNQSVTCELQADGVTKFTFYITSTEFDRNRTVVVPTGLTGYRWRIYIDLTQHAIVSNGAAFQLFNHSIKFQPADKGEVQHTFDWDDLGHPWDKYLHSFTIEWDNGNALPLTLQLDIIGGPTGQSVGTNVAQYTISGGRGKKDFPIPRGTIAKLIRLYPIGVPSTVLKLWKYEFQKENFPPDVVAFTPSEDGGYSYLKYCNQVMMEVNTNGADVECNLQADNDTKFTFTINSTVDDRQRFVTVPTGVTGYRWKLYVDPNTIPSGGMWQLFNHSFKFQQADKGEVGHTFDWDDLGHPYDKLLLSVVFEYDTTIGGPITLQMDTLTGIGGVTENPNVAQFVLGAGRGKTEFGLLPDTIAKMVRVYPVGSSIPAGYKQWKYHFEKVPYPADVVYLTPWKDAETGNEKNPSWLFIDADTNGVAAGWSLENETGLVLNGTHTGTTTNRKANYPIPVDIFGKNWRLRSVPGTGGKFQLFQFGFERWQPTDQASGSLPPDTVLWSPWRDASSPQDKNPSWVWVDADTNSIAVPIQLVNESGVQLSFSHAGSRTSRKSNYAISADTFGKMWRLLATPGTGAKLQLFNWGFDRWQRTEQASGVDPIEIVLWTPWNDHGWPYGSIARNLILTINTNGVSCSIALQTENGTVQTFPVATTYETRRVVLPCNSNLIGKMWRLLLTPGTSGWSQVWDWSMEVLKEPAAVTQWDSYELTFGSKFFKFVKQGWFLYTCSAPVTLTITSDTGAYPVTLPAHTTRAEERFYLPVVWGAGLNKSKTYRVQLVSASPFKFYQEGSGFEFLVLGSDRHEAYQQMTFSEMMTLGEGG